MRTAGVASAVGTLTQQSKQKHSRRSSAHGPWTPQAHLAGVTAEGERLSPGRTQVLVGLALLPPRVPRLCRVAGRMKGPGRVTGCVAA